MAPEDALRAYCAAFETKDRNAVVALFGANGLYEFPLLGQRVAGRGSGPEPGPSDRIAPYSAASAATASFEASAEPGRRTSSR